MMISATDEFIELTFRSILSSSKNRILEYFENLDFSKTEAKREISLFFQALRKEEFFDFRKEISNFVFEILRKKNLALNERIDFYKAVIDRFKTDELRSFVFAINDFYITKEFALFLVTEIDQRLALTESENIEFFSIVGARLTDLFSSSIEILESSPKKLFDSWHYFFLPLIVNEILKHKRRRTPMNDEFFDFLKSNLKKFDPDKVQKLLKKDFFKQVAEDSSIDENEVLDIVENDLEIKSILMRFDYNLFFRALKEMKTADESRKAKRIL